MCVDITAAMQLCLAALCLPCSAAELAKLRAGAHGQPWARLLPQGGSGPTPQGGPAAAAPLGTAAVDFFDIQGRAALEVGENSGFTVMVVRQSAGVTLQGSAATCQRHAAEQDDCLLHLVILYTRLAPG